MCQMRQDGWFSKIRSQLFIYLDPYLVIFCFSSENSKKNMQPGTGEGVIAIIH